MGRSKLHGSMLSLPFFFYMLRPGLSGTKSEEIEDIARSSMAPIAVDSIRTTDPMVILRAQGIP